MSEPYYSDEHVTLYHGDAAEVLADMEDASVSAVITDPPYTERTHGMAKSNKGKGHGTKAIKFDAFTDEMLNATLMECGRVSAGWVIATLDYRHAVLMDITPPAGLRMMRVGAWVKTNPMPQISADRPAQGWESIAYMHRADGKPAWNGGGKHGNYVLPVAQNHGHPTSKPIEMLEDMVLKFTKSGDTILDPFAGSGTTLRAAKSLGRKAVGVEIDERYCEVIAKRLGQEAFDFGEMTA